MNAWVARDVRQLQDSTLGANVTGASISKQFPITAGGSKYLVVAIEVSGVTLGGGITAKLNSSLRGGTNLALVQAETVSITGNGIFYIKHIVDSDDDLLLPIGQITIDTGAGSAVTVDAVHIVQED